jgi:SPP1 family predicted phage head-tail adaptor
MAAPTSTVDFGENFDSGKTVWAALKTTQGREMFYTTNMDEAVSHIFYVRWYDTLTSDLWVRFNGENYDIVQVENLDERDQFAALYCNVRGDSTDAVNDA